MSDLRDALIQILQEEIVRLKNENKILNKTSDYQFWTEEGSYHLVINDQEFHTQGEYSVKISICAREEDENAWYGEDMDDLMDKYVSNNLPEGSIDFYYMHDMDIGIISAKNTIFSICLGDFRGTTIKNDMCDHNHQGPNDHMFCVNVLRPYGQIQRHHAIKMITEILENTKNISVVIG